MRDQLIHYRAKARLLTRLAQALGSHDLAAETAASAGVFQHSLELFDESTLLDDPEGVGRLIAIVRAIENTNSVTVFMEDKMRDIQDDPLGMWAK